MKRIIRIASFCILLSSQAFAGQGSSLRLSGVRSFNFDQESGDDGQGSTLRSSDFSSHEDGQGSTTGGGILPSRIDLSTELFGQGSATGGGTGTHGVGQLSSEDLNVSLSSEDFMDQQLNMDSSLDGQGTVLGR